MTAIPPYLKIVERIKAEFLAQAGEEANLKLPTQAELAARFGVSRSTIIRCLARLAEEGLIKSSQGSGIYMVPSTARQEWKPSISLIVPDLRPSVIVSACRGVERRARQSGYQVMLASSEYGLSHEKELVEQHLRAGAKGIILYPVTRMQSDLATDYLMRWDKQVPLVTLDISCEQWPCSQVLFDNVRLGYDMTRQLIEHGARRIAFMHTSRDHLHSSIHDRRKGWQQAMTEAGLPIPAGYLEWPTFLQDFAQARKGLHAEGLVESLLHLHPRPDAVIAWHSKTAANLILTLLQRGICVPEDMRVVGFDTEPDINCMLLPPFSTSRPDFARMGEIAVDVLIRETLSAPQKVYYLSVPVDWQEDTFSMIPRNLAVMRSAPLSRT